MADLNGVPEGYQSVQPYLMFKSCVEAIAFYEKAFGAVQRLCMKGPDGRVGHAELELGNSCIMMADENEQLKAFSPMHYGGSPISLMFYTKDCDVVYSQAIDAGAEGIREPADQPYGDRMCGIKDPFGYTWYIATHIEDFTREELERMA